MSQDEHHRWMRRLSEDITLNDAEVYARGGRRLTVHHGPVPTADVARLMVAVEEALWQLPGHPVTGPTFTSEGRYSRWSFYPPQASEHLRAARRAAEQIGPTWPVEADDH